MAKTPSRGDKHNRRVRIIGFVTLSFLWTTCDGTCSCWKGFGKSLSGASTPVAQQQQRPPWRAAALVWQGRQARRQGTTTSMKKDTQDDRLWSSYGPARDTQSPEYIVPFNHAGASPSPPSVVQRVMRHLEREVQVGGYLAAQEAQEELQDVYRAVEQLVQAGRGTIALVESATVGWTRVFYSLVHTLTQYTQHEGGDCVLLVSEAEYAANLVAMVQFAREQNRLEGDDSHRGTWRVMSIPCSQKPNKEGVLESTGIVDLNVFDSMLAGTYPLPTAFDDAKPLSFLDPRSIAMVCITHIPTNAGIVNPVYEMGQRLAHFNAQHPPRRRLETNSHKDLPSIFYLVDACQSVGHVSVDVQAMQCHALTGTGRKYLRGPRGTGFLYVSSEVVSALVPSHIDHASARVVQYQSPCGAGLEQDGALEMEYAPGARRFEFWESNIATRLGLGTAIRFALQEERNGMEERCRFLAGYCQELLRQDARIHVHHATEGLLAPCGIVTFGVDGYSAEFLKEALLLPDDDEVQGSLRFEVSVVPASSTPIDSATTQTSNLVRASLSYFNTQQQIDAFYLKLHRVIHKE